MTSRTKLRAVFLDVGGTLLVERPSRVEIYHRVARSRGLEVELESMRRSMHAVHADLPRELGPHFRYSHGWFQRFIELVFVRDCGLPRERLAEVEEELFTTFADPRTFQLFPGALELLRELRESDLRVGVISNWSEALPGVLAGLGVAAWLDFELVSALERVEKPEPAIFERALARAGVRADEALHAGDDLGRDVQGARSVGILPVFVDRRAEHPEADCARVLDLFELRRWVRNVNATT